MAHYNNPKFKEDSKIFSITTYPNYSEEEQNIRVTIINPKNCGSHNQAIHGRAQVLSYLQANQGQLDTSVYKEILADFNYETKPNRLSAEQHTYIKTLPDRVAELLIANIRKLKTETIRCLTAILALCLYHTIN